MGTLQVKYRATTNIKINNSDLQFFPKHIIYRQKLKLFNMYGFITSLYLSFTGYFIFSPVLSTFPCNTPILNYDNSGVSNNRDPPKVLLFETPE